MKRSRHSPSGREKAESVILFLAIALVAIAFTPIAEGDVLFETLNSRRIHRLGFLFAATILLVGYGGYFGRIRMRARDPSFLIAGIFGLWALLTVGWSPNPTFSLFKTLEYLLLVTIAATFTATLSYATMSAERFARIVAFALTSVIALYLLFNLFEFGTLFHVIPSFGRGDRFALGYAHPLETADIISLAIIAIIAAKGSWWWRAPLAIALGVLVIWAKPIAPGLGLLAGLIAMTVVPLRKEGHLKSILFLGLLGVIGFYSFEMLTEIIALPPETTQSLGTLSGRVPLWEYALQQGWEKPIMGYGFFSARFILLDTFGFAGTAHNTFVEIFLTTGVVGLGLLVLFAWYVLKRAWTLKDRMLIGTSIFVLTHAMTDYVIFTPGVPTIILLMAVLTANRENEIRRTEFHQTPKFAYGAAERVAVRR